MARSSHSKYAWALLGHLLPILFAIVALKALITFAGIERLGVITLVWALVGYLGFLDLGLGRAITRRVATSSVSPSASVRRAALAEAVWVARSAFKWCVFIAAIGSILMLQFGKGVVNFSAVLSTELLWVTPLALACLPPLVASNILRGALEGMQNFKAANQLRIYGAALTYLLPCMAAFITPHLGVLVCAIVLGRWLSWLMHERALAKVLAEQAAHSTLPITQNWRQLLQEGGWITLTNVIGPVMVTLDRFAIAAMFSLSTVTYYATPQEVLTKVGLIPIALSTVLFAELAAHQQRSAEQATHIARASERVFAALMLPATVAAIVAAPWWLNVWLGADFAAKSLHVAALLMLGVFFNGLAQAPFSFLQSQGRARSVALSHLGELCVYAVLFWWLTTQFGIVGAAFTWAIRAAADCFILNFLAFGRDWVLAPTQWLLVIAVLGLAIASVTVNNWQNVGVSLLIAALLAVAAMAISWFSLLSSNQRSSLRASLTTISRAAKH
jgi:O-antigen/teichoic acid export membrane protein